MQLFLGALLLAAVTSIRCPDGQYTDANNLGQPCMLNCAVCSGPGFCSAGTDTSSTRAAAPSAPSEFPTVRTARVMANLATSANTPTS